MKAGMSRMTLMTTPTMPVAMEMIIQVFFTQSIDRLDRHYKTACVLLKYSPGAGKQS